MGVARARCRRLATGTLVENETPNHYEEQHLERQAPQASVPDSDEIRTRGGTAAVLAGLAADAVTDSLTGDGDEGKAGTTWKEHLFNGMALAAVGTSAAAVVIEGGLVVNIVAGICAVLGPAAALQQSHISDTESMRSLALDMKAEMKQLKKDMNDYKKENDLLKKTNEELQGAATALEEISSTQGKSVDALIQQVETFHKIREDIKRNLEAEVLQNLLSVILKSDMDDDSVIDPHEVDGLIMQLHLIDGVDLNEELFRKEIAKSGYSVKAVLNVAKNLMDRKVPRRNSIIIVREERLLPKDMQPRDLPQDPTPFFLRGED